MITATYKGKRYEVEYSVVNVSELEGALRIDAENYEPRLFEIQRKIESKKYDILSNLVTNEYKVFRPKDCEEFYYLEISNVDTSTGEYELEMIPCSLAPSRAKKVVEEKDVLISTVRPNRNAVAIALQIKEKPFVASTGFCKLRVISREITAEYLFVLFKTEYFRDFLVRKTTATMYPAVSEEDIMSLKIPILSDTFQKQIQNLVLQSYDEKEKSVSLYKKAEDTLLEELGLKDWKPKTKKIFVGGKEYEEEENISIRNLSEVLKADRMDAEYWQPKYEEVKKLLMKKVKVEKLKNVVSFINHGKQPYYVENGDVPVLIQKHLGSQLLSLYSEIVNMPDTPRTDREFIKNYPEYLIKPFDVLFYSVGAYLGRTNIVLENFEAVPASFITLIRTKQEVCNPVYLALFLNSEIGQLQSSRWKSASAQQYIYPKEIKEFIIPLLPLPIQQKIASLVQQSYEARKKSKELLEIAKRAVEIAIEENEDKAKVYMASEKLLSSN